ncbi:hypothetical protein [Falsiruegeria mediterranea]
MNISSVYSKARKMHPGNYDLAGDFRIFHEIDGKVRVYGEGTHGYKCFGTVSSNGRFVAAKWQRNSSYSELEDSGYTRDEVVSALICWAKPKYQASDMVGSSFSDSSNTTYSGNAQYLGSFVALCVIIVGGSLFFL